MRLFIDTWGWVTLNNTRETRHSEVAGFWKQVLKSGGILYTTDYVLTETYTLLFKRLESQRAKRAMERIEKNVVIGDLQLLWMTPERFDQTKRLRLKYQDKPDISFTDLSSMVVMKELGIDWVLTGDAHFTHVGMGFQLKP
jgi:uncharacterized protein